MDKITEQLKNINVDPIPTNWFDLPLEMREMIIDRMDPKTRCRFAQCSKLCEEEAKSSKNYLYGISVSSSGQDSFENLNSSQSFILQIYHNKKEADYTMKFIADGPEKTIVIYETYDISWIEWTKLEHGHPEEVRSRYFEEFVEKYNHSIKYLNVHAFNELLLVYNNVRNLKHLEQINIKIRSVDVIQCGFLTKNQVMNAKQIDLEDTNFTFEEVLQFEGSHYIIKSEDFDEDHIVEYIKLWKNGKVSKNLKNLTVYKTLEEGDFGRLMEGLDALDFISYGDSCEFKFYADHHKNDQLRTTVEYDPFYFSIGI